MIKKETQRRLPPLSFVPLFATLTKSAGVAPAFVEFGPLLSGLEWEIFFIGFLLILVFVLLILLVYSNFRARQLARRAQERLREKVAQDFHDELGSKLTIITLYSELTRQVIDDDTGPAQQYLEKISRTTVEAYGSMKDLIWSLKPVEDTLEDLGQRLQLTAQELFEEAGIRYHVEVLPGDRNQLLPHDFKRHVLLILKEAMHNALRHSNCTAVRLELERREGILRARLTDNGCGFDPGGSLQGEGMKNMKNRARQLRGELQIRSSGQGTEVLLRCPLPAN